MESKNIDKGKESMRRGGGGCQAMIDLEYRHRALNLIANPIKEDINR